MFEFLAGPSWFGLHHCSLLFERRKTMNTFLKTHLLTAVVVGLSISATAKADFRDYADSKAWTNFGRSSSRSYTASRSYRSNAPVIVRSEAAPTTVAQTPTERRSFSYEPAESGKQAVTSGGCGCGTSVRTERVPETAQHATQTERSYSYEPSTDSKTTEPAVRSYSAPRMRSSQPSRSSNTPLYMLPKTDPRRFNAR